MAFKPSDKRKTKDEDINPNILPIMNLMVVLIPVLLSLSQKVQLSLLEYLPPPVEVVSEDADDGNNNDDGGGGEEPARIDLLLNVSDEGFEVSMFGDTKGDNFKKIERKPMLIGGQPLIDPNTGQPVVEYDFTALHDELVRIRKEVIGKPLRTEDYTDPKTGAMARREIFKYEDAQKMNIAAKGSTPWKVMVNILDAAREFEDSTGVLSDGTVVMGKKPLFPQPGFGQLQ